MDTSEPILYDRIAIENDWKEDLETRQVVDFDQAPTTWLPDIFGKISSFLRTSGISPISPSQLPTGFNFVLKKIDEIIEKPIVVTKGLFFRRLSSKKNSSVLVHTMFMKRWAII